MGQVSGRGDGMPLDSSGTRADAAARIRRPAKPPGPGPNLRRSDYDVTDAVQVSSAAAVSAAVETLYGRVWPGASFEGIRAAYVQVESMFDGRVPAYHGIDTVYHDRQHTLDISLAMARLCAGYELQVLAAERLGAERAAIGIIAAIFHDIGYLRRADEASVGNGAEFTRNHVSRGVEFLTGYLPQIGYAAWVPVAQQILHFTGYEVPFSRIVTPDARDRKLGHLLGTADIMAQMADRCYLEKCRDRLYPEFVLGGVALPISSNGDRQVRYASGLDLLRQTPEFISEAIANRFERNFEHAYRYVEVLFGGRNPYMESIQRNAEFLNQVLRSESWQMLRRRPPVFAAHPDPMGNVRGHMLSYIKKAWFGS